MPGTVRRGGLQQLCTCRVKVYVHRRKRTKDRCRKKRQAFVYNPEEEIWHEPYMQALRREFSDESMLCDSKIELPWRDIALPTAGMRIRSELSAATAVREADEAETETVGGESQRRESSGAMVLPWKDLLIAETQWSAPDDPSACDSALEIPWADLVLEKPMAIGPPREERTCATDDVEIPWDEILVPRNIVIEPERKRRHPSSDRPPRPRLDAPCLACGTPTCCARVRANTRSKGHGRSHANVADPTWTLTCM
ncbi:PREDICTED: uncharacterized protein LOC105568466 [Vollenhovia emeryi]|uniref:uncharacterized protein LOC105568466 n=1 Tax=Vollenhovia emeryi TaxID=411798 RepID=UPI0005F3BC86|nr:PREDICTED: uncharacterized protein LOC105568466 [Vollenhovia emeryi]